MTANPQRSADADANNITFKYVCRAGFEVAMRTGARIVS